MTRFEAMLLKTLKGHGTFNQVATSSNLAGLTIPKFP